MKEQNEIAVGRSETPSIETIIQNAVSANVPIETIERLMTMRRELKAEAAKEAFIRDMSTLQSKLPIIRKLKQGHVAAYAPLEDEVKMVGPIISKYGFSYRWNTSQQDKQITVTCVATHELGHSEETSMTSEIEEVVTGNASGKSTKSSPQRIASTITFLKRYTLNNMFGIQVAGDDLDGRAEKQKNAAKSSMFETAKALIVKIRNVDKLTETQENIATSAKYSDAEKKQLVDLIKKEIAKLK
jgi:hypothetical protein